jgi:hypothetical protein
MVQRVSSTPSQPLSKPTLLYVFPCPHLPISSQLTLTLSCPPLWGWEHQNNTNKLFEQYDVQKNVDILHQVVTEARARRQRGETGDGGTRVDGWRADLQPRAAVRAGTIPALERERDSLRARLAEVRFSFIHPPPFLRLPGSSEPVHANAPFR